MQVELDLFSGRINPSWRLTANESEEFLKLFRALPPAQQGAIQDRLGYRGIIVTVPGGTVAGFDNVLCSAGIVVGRCTDGEQKFIDRDRTLERWLFRTSTGRVDDEIRAAVEQELDSKN